MAKNITYLIGAGASINALPVVKGFDSALIDMINKMANLKEKISDINQKKKYDAIITEFEVLRQGCINHASIDTYAKMLFLRGDDLQYKRTKCAIILFFEVYRFFYQAFDKRYDAFLASILNKSEPRFPNNIRFISWNYDYEFEKAFLKYSKKTENIDEVYKELNITHKNGVESSGDYDRFGIVKINGTAGFISDNSAIHLGLGHSNLFSSPYSSNSVAIMPIIEKYLELTSNWDELRPAISFAWEHDNSYKRMIVEVQNTIKKTDVLVVIGYSFPYFNREMDKEIFESLPIVARHCKIYIQDPDALNLIENIKGLRAWWPIQDIVPIINTDQFYMPHEL